METLNIFFSNEYLVGILVIFICLIPAIVTTLIAKNWKSWLAKYKQNRIWKRLIREETSLEQIDQCRKSIPTEMKKQLDLAETKAIWKAFFEIESTDLHYLPLLADLYERTIRFTGIQNSEVSIKTAIINTLNYSSKQLIMSQDLQSAIGKIKKTAEILRDTEVLQSLKPLNIAYLTDQKENVAEKEEKVVA